MQLKPYQIEGAQWLAARSRALLADEPRVGKSPQVVAACDLLGADRVTVLCPPVALRVWPDIFILFSDRPRTIAIWDKRRLDDADVVVCSYDRAARPEIAARLAARDGAILVCDEAHYIKSPDAKRTKAVLGPRCSGEGGIAERHPVRWFVTGTPTPNHHAELFPLLRASGLTDASYAQFIERYCITVPTDYGFRVVGVRRGDELREIVRPWRLRRTQSDVQITAPTIEHVAIDPGECDAAVLAELSALPLASEELSRALTEGDVAAISEHPHLTTARRLTGLAKAGAVARAAGAWLRDNPGRKRVLFFWHREPIDIVSHALAEYQPAIVVGGMTSAQRERARARFQRDPQCRVAVCQIRAAGTAIELHAADTADIVEASWSPADNFQAGCRVVNMHQRRPPVLRYVSLAGSIDHAVMGVLARKHAILSEVSGN